jgi:diaminopimelate decarboxylase
MIRRRGLDRVTCQLLEIVRSVGTPVYVYDWQTISDTIQLIIGAAEQAELTNLRFYVAFFSLPNLRLMERIVGLDPRIGVALNTPEEVASFRSANWQEWYRTVFSGGILPKLELEEIARSGCLVHAASKGNALKLGSQAARLGLRLDLVGTALKGIRLEELKACVADVHAAGGIIEALHAYPGTQVKDMRHLISRHADVLMKQAGQFTTLKEINFGGGFFYDYASHTGDTAEMFDFRHYFSSVASSLHKFRISDGVRLAWEPGRVAFAGAGFFLTEVVEVRTCGRNADVYVDASFVQMPAPKLRGRSHIVICFRDGTLVAGEEYEARICGGTTLSTDEFFPDRVPLPEVRPGDLLMIFDVGAYGYSGAYNFLGKAKPPEVLVDGDHYQLLRKRQRNDHILEDLLHEREFAAIRG